jgi:serine/threonine-protein kinase RsbW
LIRATVPGRLEYRDLAIRMVASACKLVSNGGDDFYNETISAFSEALNNLVLHGKVAEVGIEIEPHDDRLTIRLMDYGKAFDPTMVLEPDLTTLPESGMGIYIMRSFMDDVAYRGGTPNTLTMTKFVKTTAVP